MTIRAAHILVLATFILYPCCAPGAHAAEGDYKVKVDRSTPNAPSAVQYACAAYDAKRDVLLVFGGVDPERKAGIPELRKLDLRTTTWSAVPIDGPAPQAVTLPAMVYDANRDALFLFGGWANGAEQPSGDLWTLPLEPLPLAWKKLAAGPPARNGCVMVLDAQRDRLVVFGGDGGPHPKFGFTPLDDLWAFDLTAGTWTRLTPTGEAPAPRWNLAGAVDNQNGRLFLFGGVGYTNADAVRDRDVFELDLAKLVWTKHVCENPRPAPEQGATLTWDSNRRVLVLVGGLSVADTGDAGSTSLWTYDVRANRWHEAPHAFQTTRRGHIAIYDTLRDLHLVIGGETAIVRRNFYILGTSLRDVLKVSLSAK